MELGAELAGELRVQGQMQEAVSPRPPIQIRDRIRLRPDAKESQASSAPSPIAFLTLVTFHRTDLCFYVAQARSVTGPFLALLAHSDADHPFTPGIENVQIIRPRPACP